MSRGVGFIWLLRWVAETVHCTQSCSDVSVPAASLYTVKKNILYTMPPHRTPVCVIYNIVQRDFKLFLQLDYHENLRYLFVGNLALYYSWDSRLCVHTCMHACVFGDKFVYVHIIITTTIISDAQILKKPSALYKEHDGRWGSWLMHLYKNKAKIKHIH